MGTFLLIGIVHEMTIYKDDAKEISFEQLEKALNKEIPLNNYVCSQNEDSYRWNINPNLLTASNLIPFLKRQFEFISGELDEYQKEVLNNLQNLKNSNEIITHAKEESVEHFQHAKSHFEYINIPNGTSTWGRETDVPIDWSFIVFHAEGKMILECYRETFNYIDNLIRLQRNEFPIADCAKVYITK